MTIIIPQSQDERRFEIPGTTLSAHQPEFLPWLGNISKASMADVYMILDHVQYVKDVFQNRNKIRIKSETGWQWLCVPVKGAGGHITLWKDVKIDNDQPWVKKHLTSIYQSYHKTTYFYPLYKKLEAVYNDDNIFLLDFVIKLYRIILKEFKINIPIYRTSNLIEQGACIEGKKTDLIISMCEAVRADNFIFGSVGKTYMNPDKFSDNNIKYLFQNFMHPQYTQIHGEFISHMSSIDLLFNHGLDSIKIIGKSTGEDSA
jgi:hypothetical protein